MTTRASWMSEHRPMLDDGAARQRALDPATSFIVQAPAGSGKTELLTQRHLRLLATVEEPEQILAITFTRKAAAEMRARILKALVTASSDVEPERPHARVTWQLARAVRALDAERGWRLEEHPARLRIQTIDALTGMLARRLPLLSGMGAALEPAEDAKPLYYEAVERLLDHLGEDDAAGRALASLIAHLGNQVERLVQLLVDLLGRRDQWLPAILHARASADFRAIIEGTLRAVVQRHLEQMCLGLSEARRCEIWELTCFAAGNLLARPDLDAARRRLLEGYERIARTPGPDTDSLAAWRIVADIFLKRDGGLYRTVTVRQGFPPTQGAMKTRMETMLAELAEDETFCEQLLSVRTLPPLTYNDEQWTILEALFTVLPVAVAELHIVFQQHKRCDYVESALRALRALGTGEEATDLALALDYRIRHILVDEFQDTSFTQIALLERLTAGWTPGDGRTLFCVGDPMQSIYRFRQAEVGLFIELQRHGLAHLPLEPLTLTSNFRSTIPVVSWVNDVFRTVFPPHDDVEQGAVRYSASVAAKSDESGGVYVHPLFGAKADSASTVVDIVQRALARDQEGTVAILVAGRKHLGSIASALTAAGIEHQAVEIEMLSERPVVQDLMALTRALTHLADRTAWLAVLRAPWCGLTLADLHAIAAGAPQATIRELLERALASNNLSSEGRARAERAYRVLELALAERGRQPLRDWVERTWIALGGPATLREPQDLDDARAYFRKLDELDEAGDIADVTQLEERLEGLCAWPRADARARVEIMTIHKAKGLEFDTVIVPGLDRVVKGDDQPLLHWTRVAGVDEGLIFAPLTAAGAEADPVYRWAELLERERTAHERARLLYVAATRAKRELHLIGSVELKESEDGLELRPPRKGTMLALLWPHVEARYREAMGAYVPEVAQTTSERPSVLLKRLPLTWQAPEPDADVRVPESARVEIVDAARPEFDWVTETSRRIGTLVHRELERMVSRDTGALDAHHSSPGVRARMRAELAELGVPDDRCEAALERVLAAIRATLDDPKGRWLLGLESGISDAHSELALSGVVNGRVIQSVIDRTFVAADGVRWIVDFKTSTHEGAGLERFLEEEARRYRPQLERYAMLMRALNPAEPVKAALYFPLMKRWVEVAV